MTVEELIAALEADVIDADLVDEGGIREILDDFVHSAKADEASGINNGGIGDQVRYLLGDNPTAAAIERLRQEIYESLPFDEDGDTDEDDDDEE